MAKRTRTYQTDKTREKIKATQLVNRLQAFAQGDEGVDMSAAQVKAAQILLSKVLPDLTHEMVEEITPETNAEQQFLKLVDRIGEPAARTAYPDMARKYLDKEPAHILSIVK